MKVLVTGANGFLGREVTRSFLQRGHTVTALVRPAADAHALEDPGVEIVRADLRSPSTPLDAALDGVAALVHLAAGMAGDEHDQFASTVVGTERLLCALSRTPTRRVVLASSISVYDWSAARDPLTETSPLTSDFDERGGYTRAKVWQERVARLLSERHGFELTVLRPGILWGRGDTHFTGVGRQLRRATVVVGPLRPMPLSYVENCADCFVSATLDERAVGETFNVVDPGCVTAWRYFDEHRRRTNTSPVPVPVPYAVGLAAARAAQAAARRVLGEQPRLPSIAVPARFEAAFKPIAVSGAKLAERLGWLPPYRFEEALARTYRETAVPPSSG